MGTRIAVVVSLLAVLPLLSACQEAPPADDARASTAAAAFDDPEVERVWTRMMETIAPDDGWEQARYLEFHWAVHRGDDEPTIRRHRWDRWEGDARVASTVDEGTMVALFNVNDPEAGRVWIDDIELSGEEREDRLQSAYRAHINDGYWLLMPYKWADPGVAARYAGEQTDEDGRSWEVVELTFEGDVGLTPQNMYRAFVNPETGRMERWHFLSNPDANPSPSDWTDWRRVGPIELAENRRVDGEPRIFFPHLRVETSVPGGAFDPPTG